MLCNPVKEQAALTDDLLEPGTSEKFRKQLHHMVFFFDNKIELAGFFRSLGTTSFVGRGKERKEEKEGKKI